MTRLADRFDPARELAFCRGRGIRVLRRGAVSYPALLSETPDPPGVLYVRGRTPLAAGALAITGARRPTEYGLRMARSLASECARAGIPMVSGLALGVDSAAHRAALDAGGRSWAVLAGSLGRVYPAENEALAEDIVSAGGTLLSEVPSTGGDLPPDHARMSRILAGLAWGVVVVEGDLRSGALAASRAAAEQGREVFAVPGPADSELSAGPLELIRQGARLVRRLEDVLEELPVLAAEVPEGDRERILELLEPRPRTLDEIIKETGWELSRLARALECLERGGLAVPGPGESYGRA